MSLMERDYMKETYEDRKKARIERIEKEERKSELWYLYGKKHKTIFDKIRIKEIEQINLNRGIQKSKPYISIIKFVLIVIIFMLIVYITFQFHELYSLLTT